MRLNNGAALWLYKQPSAPAKAARVCRAISCTIPHGPVIPCLLPSMKTFSAKATEVPRKWWIIDAKNQVLGRVAVKAATLLRGKEKPIFTPHVDTGDFVIVINADKVRLTGKKEEQKTFMSFSGFVGGTNRKTPGQPLRHRTAVEGAVRE